MEGVTVMENKQDAIFETIEKLRAFQSKRMAQNVQKMMHDKQKSDNEQKTGCAEDTPGLNQGSSSWIAQNATAMSGQKRVDENGQKNVSGMEKIVKRTQNISGLEEQKESAQCYENLEQDESVKVEEQENKIGKKPTTLAGIEKLQQDEKLNRANKRVNLNDIQKMQEQEKLQKAQTILGGERNRALVDCSMEDYRIVREYLREHGSANALTIEKATGISRRVIDRMIKEDMLSPKGK